MRSLHCKVTALCTPHPFIRAAPVAPSTTNSNRPWTGWLFAALEKSWPGTACAMLPSTPPPPSLVPPLAESCPCPERGGRQEASLVPGTAGVERLAVDTCSTYRQHKWPSHVTCVACIHVRRTGGGCPDMMHTMCMAPGGRQAPISTASDS
jgi:hypothetical protein